jgi:hypothetical protein
MLVPTEIGLQGQRIPLLESWETTCEIFADNYSGARRKDRDAKKQAAQLAPGANSLLDRIAAIHAFVRDEVRTEPSVGIGVGEDEKVDRVLQDRSGTPVAKALLLQSMLEGVKLDSELVWVADRTAGTPDLGLANPWWFDAAVVRVEVDGRQFYLDPVDRRVGFGRLPPYYAGTQGLLFHRKNPRIVDLPQAPHDANLRRAVVDLKIDDECLATITPVHRRQLDLCK